MSGIKKRILGLGAALALGATTAWTAEMFSDVPRGHWAYDAISRAVEAGVLEGVDGKFMGNKLITRHQMAVIVAKLLDRIEKGGSAVASKLQPRDVANLEALTIEFADELALMNVKLSTLEDAFVELKNSVEALKAGRAVEDHPHKAGAQFSGLLSVGVVAADDGTGGPAAAGGPAFRTRYAPAVDTAFTVPQASLGLDLDVGQGVGVHTQFDYSTDLASGPGPLVALNQAYLTWDNGPGPFGLKAGLMALPFQSWEYNGPQRTLMNSITPSTLNRFWELHRIVGVEAQKSVNQTADSWKWRLGIFTGNDLTTGVIGGGPFASRVYGGLLGLSSDAPVAGTGTATFDGSIGYYLDLESGTTGRFGWRLGYFDVGGDNTTTAPNVPSNDWSGFQVGGWYRGSRWQAQAQGVFGDEDYGGGAANTDDLAAFHLSLRYDLSDERNVFVRYDSWDVDNQAAGTGTGTGDAGGNVITLAYNHKVTDTSMLQFEYLAPDEDTATGSTDIDDTLIQGRYKVWW